MCRRKSAMLTSFALILGLGLSAAHAQETRQTEPTDVGAVGGADGADLDVAGLQDLIEELFFYSGGDDLDELSDQPRWANCDPTECPHLYGPDGKSRITDGSPTRASALDYRDLCGIVWTDPPNCAVDARQPHALNDASIRFGWQSIEMPFFCCNARSLDFTCSVEYGRPPEIVNMVVDGFTVTLELSEPIPPGQWTCITHNPTETMACFGYLPGDVDGDLTAAPADIITFINSLNGVVVPRPDYMGDIDRDGYQAPADILRVVDLLNGAAAFDPWLDVSLPPCPSARR